MSYDIPFNFQWIDLGATSLIIDVDDMSRSFSSMSTTQLELTISLGSGLGALANLLSSHPPENLFPGLDFPSTHHTPVLKAAYVFSLLT